MRKIRTKQKKRINDENLVEKNDYLWFLGNGQLIKAEKEFLVTLQMCRWQKNMPFVVPHRLAIPLPIKVAVSSSSLRKLPFVTLLFLSACFCLYSISSALRKEWKNQLKANCFSIKAFVWSFNSLHFETRILYSFAKLPNRELLWLFH